jgi:hypothetical protein
MEGSLSEHFKKSQKYLSLGDNETFKGLYINWDPITTKWGKPGYKFTFEREDGSRLEWTTGNSRAIRQMSDLIDKGLKKGDPVLIKREGTTKENTVYTVEATVPF